MTDSTGNDLLTGLQTRYTNYESNLTNQRAKGVVVGGEALEVRLLYDPTGNVYHIHIIHLKTGLTMSDDYSSYANALSVYNSIT